MKEIYQQTVEEVLDHVESRESGLTSEQVERSRSDVLARALHVQINSVKKA